MEILVQEVGALFGRHQARTGMIHQHCCQQFHTDKLTIIYRVPVDELATDAWVIGDIPHLIEEQVAESIVDERVIVKLHHLGEVRLATADNGGACICYAMEVF